MPEEVDREYQLVLVLAMQRHMQICQPAGKLHPARECVECLEVAADEVVASHEDRPVSGLAHNPWFWVCVLICLAAYALAGFAVYHLLNSQFL